MSDPASFKYEDIQLGQAFEFEICFSQELVDDFAKISGDTNPLHTDKNFAAKTTFGQPIAHGMLGAAFLSRLIGMHLPGLHALYLSQNLFFRNPIFIGTDAVVRGTVVQKTDAVKIVKIATTVIDRKTSQLLLDGEAMVKVLE